MAMKIAIRVHKVHRINLSHSPNHYSRCYQYVLEADSWDAVYKKLNEHLREVRHKSSWLHSWCIYAECHDDDGMNYGGAFRQMAMSRNYTHAAFSTRYECYITRGGFLAEQN